MTPPSPAVTKVLIIESERGWSQRVDETKTFQTRKAAEAFVKKFNAKNNNAEVPDWNMYARVE